MTPDFRALGVQLDGSRTCTAILQSAIDRCHQQGGGRLTLGAGTYRTGTLRLRSGVFLDLHPGARLLGSPDLADYPVQPTPAFRSVKDAGGFRALLYAEGETDLGLIGQGTIDGQGAVFPFGGGDQDGRPRGLQFVSCHNVTVTGLTLRDSGLWMQHYLDCERVQLHGLRVWNHANRNNDLLDIDGCRHVTVSDVIGDTDDDGITLKSTGLAPCEYVTISNCLISSRCNAIKLGTESTGGFRHISIRNCQIRPTAAVGGFYGNPRGTSAISLEVVDGGTLEAVEVSNILVEGTRSPIFLRLANRARPHRADWPRPAIGRLRDVSLRNIRIREAGEIGCSISGLPGHPVEDVRLQNISIENALPGPASAIGPQLPELADGYPEATMWGPLPAHGFFLRHVRRIHLQEVRVQAPASEPRPAWHLEDADDVRFTHCCPP